MNNPGDIDQTATTDSTQQTVLAVPEAAVRLRPQFALGLSHTRRAGSDSASLQVKLQGYNAAAATASSRSTGKVRHMSSSCHAPYHGRVTHRVTHRVTCRVRPPHAPGGGARSPRAMRTRITWRWRAAASGMSSSGRRRRASP
eukprot:2778828-Prymnesium_polylepis.1